MNRRTSIIFPLRRNPCDLLGICQHRRPPCKGCAIMARWETPPRRQSSTKRLVVWMTKLVGAFTVAIGCVIWLGLLIVQAPR